MKNCYQFVQICVKRVKHALTLELMLKWALWTLLSETENSDIKVSSVNSNDDNEWGNNSFYT